MLIAVVILVGLILAVSYVMGTWDRCDEKRRARDLDNWYSEEERHGRL